ncbi:MULTISPECIES: hypothetical protein [Streptomyces]|uniref:hypothetical protein n=1 Tax=Streptomyces TaxID=1883 RepID=UPI000AC4D4DF|nr:MULTISPECIES: hypothetical protein [Streptomyces]
MPRTAKLFSGTARRRRGARNNPIKYQAQLTAMAGAVVATDALILVAVISPPAE